MANGIQYELSKNLKYLFSARQNWRDFSRPLRGLDDLSIRQSQH